MDRIMTNSRFLITLAAGAGLFSQGLGGQDKATIEKKLLSEYTLTQATADQTDIVTAGSILVLLKGNIVMAPVSGTNFFQNTYKEGKISQNALGKLNSGLTRFSRLPGAAPPPTTTRTFVPGEKVWVTKIDCKDDGVVFDLYTDAYADVRYKAALKFYFNPKGPMPSADQMDKLVAEVFKIQPADNAQPSGAAPAAPAAPAPAAPDPAATAPIAPPPPPPDAPAAPPKELKIGQTKDQVVSNFGQPQKIVKLGAKETFVNGKVTDVQ
jgi:hypothetical protein